MDLGQRFVLMIDINDIDMGTVVTLESIVDDKIGIVRYDYDEKNESKFKGVPLDFLRPATKEEIDKTAYQKIVDKSFWIGSKWRTHIKINKNINKGLVVTVLAVTPMLNSKHDYIEVAAENVDPVMLYASALKDYCIPINPTLEESLAEELSDNGHYVYIGPGERVLYDNHVVTIIKADEEKGKLEVCYDMENFSIKEINISEVSNVSTEKLSEVDYKKLIKDIRIGDKFKTKLDIPLEEIDENISGGSINKGEIVEVRAIQSISHHALKDKFIVVYEDINFELTCYDLFMYFAKL